MKAAIRSSLKANLLLVGASLVAALLLGEALLRIVLFRQYYVWPPNIVKVFRLDSRYVPGIFGDSRFETNSLGLRGDELTPSDTYRILTVGGSTTECIYLDQTKAWPALLQKSLNESHRGHKVWVGNAAMSGRSTANHIAVMRFLPLKALRIDMVVALVGVNDFQRYLSNPDYLTESGDLEQVLFDTFKGGIRPPPDASLIRGTATWCLLRYVKHRLADRASESNLQDDTGSVLERWRENRRQATDIRTAMPDLSAGLRSYEDNLNQMADLALAQSVRLIFVTQPSMWRAGLPQELNSLLWMGGIGNFQEHSGAAYYSPEALADGMERYNRLLLKVCERRGVECVDLSHLEKDTSVFYDDVHFNESGARKVAAAITAHILSGSW